MAEKLIKTLPRLKFAHLPTAVEALPHLSAELNGPRLLVKRDDQTGLAFGGNKTRKLEFLLAEAQANGARTLVTDGALQSNHCRQTAAAAARYGFACTLVLSLPPGQLEAPVQGQGDSGNLLLDRLLGANIIWTSRELRSQVVEETFQDAWDSGQRPYMIPYGGSNPTGAAAYAFAMEELLLQAVKPDWIVFASSSGGTQSGLTLGAQMFNYRGKLLGISVDEPEDILRERVAKLATETADLLGGDLEFTADDILVNADYLGGGYGVMGEAEKEAIRLFAQKEGIFLDPVYTGRAAAGLLDLIRRGFFGRDETVLFWHTGGTPALFADRYQGKI